ncbi:hypothetical protein Y032_0028g1744 [Ancylostoma ceylanicum]|uniref:Uncharacterized protein n=1 Tax=Ancylostoma ceylanicum TaxID=53326 RepID=A0A016UUS7_9BILA|nr:hypothetical protein Y032_0028g1744 [Ancylostoma ceylanicum]
MNAFSTLLLLFVAVTAVWGAVREKRQQRTVIERTVINNYGGRGFNRQPWGYGNHFGPGGGFNNGWGNPGWGGPFNRGPFGGPPPPQTVVKTTVIRHG